MSQDKTRRENGTGNIYQRANGSWVGRLTDGRGADGKLKIKYFSGKTEAEVKRKIREYNKSGDKIDPKKITVGTYITNWLLLYKKGTLKPSSFDRLENTIKHQIIPHIGGIQLQKLSSDDIQSLLTKLCNEGMSYSSIKKVKDCLGAMLRHALIKKDIASDPMLLVVMPDKSLFEKKEIRFFTKEEAALIVEECGRQYKNGAPLYGYGDAFILMLNTGIRMGEAIGLKKSDWDKENKTLHIQRNVQAVKKRTQGGERADGRLLVFNTTKTYSGDRVLPLNENATAALERLEKASGDNENLLTTRNGGVVPPERLERTFYRVLKNIGIDKTGTHSLRHTFASILFANKVDVKTISKLLGHASIQITLNTYVHLLDNVEQDAVEILDKVI